MPLLHSWNVSPAEAIALQKQLAPLVIRRGTIRSPRWIAGVDAAFPDEGRTCLAGVVLWDRRLDRVVEQHLVSLPVTFPYVPGLLTFREGPAVCRALGSLKYQPDVILFDGHGYAHPRRFGLACHIGVLLGRLSIGCAKSLLVGTCNDPGLDKGSTMPLSIGKERVGTVLRTRDGVKPIYVSVGHGLSLRAAERIVLACCTRFRMPEPTRLADRLVSRARVETLT